MKIKLLLATIGALTAAVINSHAQTAEINFTAAEGYANGNLSGQNKWYSGTATAWQVNTNGSGNATISSSAGNFKQVVCTLGTALTNGYSGSFDFSFTLGTPVANSLTVAAFKIQDSANGYQGPAFEIKAHHAGGFSMDIYNDVNKGFSSTGLGSLGTTGGTGTSANLRFGFTTTPKGNGTNWTTVLTLTNLTTGLQVGTLTQNWTTRASGQGEASHIAMQDGSLVELGGAVRVYRVAIGSDRDSLK